MTQYEAEKAWETARRAEESAKYVVECANVDYASAQATTRAREQELRVVLLRLQVLAQGDV